MGQRPAYPPAGRRTQRGLDESGCFSNPSPYFSSHLRAALGMQAPALPFVGHVMVGLSGAFGFIILVYLLVSCRYLGPW